MASQLKDAAWLEWMAGLMGTAPRQTYAGPPPERFYCLLDELPLHLIPQRQLALLRDENRRGEPLVFNPQCSIHSSGSLPAELEEARNSLTDFCLDGTIAWVRDAAFGSIQPFSLGSGLEKIVSQLVPGECCPAAIPANTRELFASAGILVPPDHAERAINRWKEKAEKSATQFQRESYVPLRSLIHPFQIAALRRYYRCAIRRGKIKLGDHQSTRRYVAYNDSAARFVHLQLTNLVGAVVGEPVKPSYVYFASYLAGAELKKHTDRAQCEFSVTLCLDFSPEPVHATSWPIRLDTAKGTAVIYQALGDGLFYRGTQVPHYRQVLPDGHTSTSIFFHYVPADFSGSLD